MLGSLEQLWLVARLGLALTIHWLLPRYPGAGLSVSAAHTLTHNASARS